jgi:hypothetical protein
VIGITPQNDINVLANPRASRGAFLASFNSQNRPSGTQTPWRTFIIASPKQQTKR